MKNHKTFLPILILLVVIFISGCTTPTTTNMADEKTLEKAQNENSPEDEKNILETEEGNEPGCDDGLCEIEAKKYSITDIAEHNNDKDCWMAINDKVYDLTKYIALGAHGPAISNGCGIDATELFETRPMGSGTPHPDKAREKLDDYYIGDLE